MVEDEITIYYWPGMIVVGILAVITIAWIKKFFKDVPCTMCANIHCAPLNSMSKDQRYLILKYFSDYERRTPEISAVFVCEECKHVHDDFSGEKRSRDYEYLQHLAFCKVCNHLMCGNFVVADIIQDHNVLDRINMTCKKCGTVHKWTLHEESGYKFLMPPSESRVLKRCKDYTLGTA